MAIINNIGCPECMKSGHDLTQNHLMVFEDGAKFCSRKQFHKNGKTYYESAKDGVPISELPINGSIKYTQHQFKELVKDGKLSNPLTRAIALSGMRMEDRWAVMNDSEKEEQQKDWDLDVQHFLKLKRTALVSRHIKPEIAVFYDIRVGREAPVVEGKLGAVNRHYYPRYENGVLVGAKCRLLPKDFKTGHLGKLFGDQDLFGMNTQSNVLDSGQTMHTVMIVGGELDAAASQQMLWEHLSTGKYEGRKYHVWSVNKGESAMSEILANKEHINRFKRIIWAFDNDDVGKKFANECAKHFPDKSFFFKYPIGMKDPNMCLMKGKGKEFVDAWFNPSDASEIVGGAIKSISSLRKKLKESLPAQGLSWKWKSLNKITLGIRKHILFVIGAGSGVGKTEFCREVVKDLIETHGESVGIISTEDPTHKVGRAYCGKWIGKRIELPPTNDPTHEDYRDIFNYTEEEANACIDYVADKGKLFIADLEGDYSMDRVEEACLEFYSMGINNILIDNLTGISVPAGVNKVEFLDQSVKRIGNLKDSKPLTIFLVTHLSRVGGNRTPHEEGGEVILADARGSGAIGQWASYFLGIERNTRAESIEERTLTYISCVKDRDQGIYTGEKVMLKGNLKTGELSEPRLGFMDTSNYVDTDVPDELQDDCPFDLDNSIEDNKQEPEYL